jgi:hypothetical protein
MNRYPEFIDSNMCVRFRLQYNETRKQYAQNHDENQIVSRGEVHCIVEQIMAMKGYGVTYCYMSRCGEFAASVQYINDAGKMTAMIARGGTVQRALYNLCIELEKVL